MKKLPPHLERMALFKVNTGCREQEVCRLRWDWEIFVPELNTSVFVVPAWVRTAQSVNAVSDKLKMVKTG